MGEARTSEERCKILNHRTGQPQQEVNAGGTWRETCHTGQPLKEVNARGPEEDKPTIPAASEERTPAERWKKTPTNPQRRG